MSRPPALYTELDSALKEALGSNYKSYLAELIKDRHGKSRSVSYINRCFTEKTQWEKEEMYQILDIINAKEEELHRYFPRYGISIDIRQDKDEAEIAAIQLTQALLGLMRIAKTG